MSRTPTHERRAIEFLVFTMQDISATLACTAREDRP